MRRIKRSKEWSKKKNEGEEAISGEGYSRRVEGAKRKKK